MVTCLSSNGLLGAATALTVQAGVAVKVLFLLAVDVGAVVKGGVLAREVVALTASADVVSSALREGTRAGGELGRDSGVGGDPVGEGILAVLDNGLAGLIAVVGGASLARGDGSVVNQLEQVLAVAGNDSKLVGVGSLDLLTSDVRELGLGDQRLCLGTDELLLKDNNLGRVGLLVLELGNLVGDLLLAWILVLALAASGSGADLGGERRLTVTAGLNRSLNVTDALHGDAVLIVAINVLVLKLTNLVEQDTELVGDVGDILVTALAPDGELLL